MSDTLFLAVSYIDRYLSTHPVMRSRLQLVGVTCLLLAAKYEEIYAPNIEEFCYITDNTYSRGDVRLPALHHACMLVWMLHSGGPCVISEHMHHQH